MNRRVHETGISVKEREKVMSERDRETERRCMRRGEKERNLNRRVNETGISDKEREKVMSERETERQRQRQREDV